MEYQLLKSNIYENKPYRDVIAHIIHGNPIHSNQIKIYISTLGYTVKT